jgi:putative ABC transport system ATP-binding protein
MDPDPGSPPPPTVDTTPAVAAEAVGASRIYRAGSSEVHALREVDVQFLRGRFTAVMGPSGSGKTTLMQCMAGLDRLSNGETFIAGQPLSGLNQTDLAKLRRDRVGFVFQAYNLVPALTAAENIVLPLALAGRSIDQAWFDRLVTATGLGDRLDHKPHELSGGQQQRVAVARAMANRPEIIFGDEPTGNLDSSTSAEILGFLRNAVDEHQMTAVIVTHDPVTATYADRVLFLSDGQVAGDLAAPSMSAVLDHIRTLDGRAPSTGSLGVRS